MAAIAAPATLHFLEGRDHGTACAGRMTGHGLALRVEPQTGAPLPLGGPGSRRRSAALWIRVPVAERPAGRKGQAVGEGSGMLTCPNLPWLAGPTI